MSFINRLIHDLTQVHPPHTMLVHFPIGLTGAALFFILLALWRGEKIFEQVAFANISLAVPSVLVTAIAGIRDNIVFYNGAAPNAGAKIILGSILLVVTLATSLVRWRKPDLFQSSFSKAIYVAAYFISFALAVTLGFLGGVILYGF